MIRFLVHFLFCISTVLFGCVGSDFISKSLEVTLNHGGVLIGRHMESAEGRYVKAFLGVPYAEPPVGELRFRALVPAKAWQGVKMAIKDGNICPQVTAELNTTVSSYAGDEDCLYLNVYVPQEPKTKDPLPVMIWLHGGALVRGSGSSTASNPRKFLDRDMIFVSINYRLATLGFLSTETLDIPGNFGLKDQLMSFKWVKEHISSFGGDPNSVTLYGQSAGSISISYHLVSEQTKGFFNRAIASSGTYMNAWRSPAPKGYAVNQTRRIAELVGCPVEQDSWKNTLSCLRTVSAKDLTEAAVDLLVWHMYPVVRVPVVVEPEHEDAFLTKPPQMNAYGDSIPLMIGFNKDEGEYYILQLLERYDSFEEFTKDLDTYFPYVLSSTFISDENQAVTKQAILEFYFGNGTITDSQNLTNAFTDAMYFNAIDELIRQRTAYMKNQTASTYVYQFYQKGAMSQSYVYSDEFKGVCHTDDTFYTFSKTPATVVPSKRDREVMHSMIDLWYNFAAFGNPTPDNSTLPKWEAVDSYPPQSMRIGSLTEHEPLLEMTSEYPEERADFWQSLEEYLKPVSKIEGLFA